MKKQSLLLNLVRIGLNILWYVNFVFLALALTIAAFSVLTTKDLQLKDVSFSVPIQYKKYSTITISQVGVNVSNTPIIKKLESSSNNISEATVRAQKLTLDMAYKKIPYPLLFLFAFILISFEGAIIFILYNLRKIFATFKHREPFKLENVKRFKHIALVIALIAPASWILHFALSLYLESNIANFNNEFMVGGDGSLGIWFLMLGAIIYVLADIFKHGFEIEQENKEFV